MSITIRDPDLFHFTPSLLIPFLLLPLFFRQIYISFGRYYFCRKHGCQEAQSKEPVKDPIIGLDFFYEVFFAKPIERYLVFLHNLYQELGSTWVSKRWTWATIYTRDARNIKYVLSTGFEDFELPRLRIHAMEGLFGSGIFTLNGHSWFVTRNILKTALAKRKNEISIKKLEGYFQAFLQRIPEVKDRDGDKMTAVTDLQPLFFWLTMDFATDFLMGRSTTNLPNAEASSLSRERDEQFIEDYKACSTETLKRMRLGPLQVFSFNASANRAKERIFGYIDDLIDESLRQKEQKMKEKEKKAEDIEKMWRARGEEKATEDERDVLSELAALSTDREQLRSQILHILVAGRDTTACLLSNLFFVLSRRPEIYAKLREEVLSVVGSEPATADDLGQMQYLKWCVKESMRIHPVIPSNARQAVRDTILPYGGGRDGNSPLFIKKGAIIIYTVFSMHRDESVFGPDPEEFIPERWNGLRPGWNYLPFNGGPRVCVGQKFALLETHYIVSRMVQVFETMEALDDKPWVELFALATTCKDGVQVRLTR